MNLEQRPGTTQIQKLSLTPEIKQSLIILQFPMADLQTYVTQQVIENCFLEYETEVPAEDDPEFGAINPLQTECMETSLPDDPLDTDWNDSYHSSDPFTPNFEINLVSQNCSAFSLSEQTNLRDYLLLQLHISPVNSRQLLIGEYLIENINQDGYLVCEPEEVARILGVDTQEVDKTVQIIQTFDPPGVAARNLGECLRIQLMTNKKSLKNASLNYLYDLALYITVNHLSDVAEGRINNILKHLNLPAGEITQAINLIKQLDPKPGRNFPDNDKPNYIFPDVIIKKNGEQFVVEVTEVSPVKLQVNHYYQQLLKQQVNQDLNTIAFLKERYQKALWIMKCLEQRKNTIYKITSAMVQVQQDFLTRGVAGLRPLTLRKIAEMTGLDESTVSRAIHGKYILTPQGMYPFKYFFASKIQSQDGATVSSKCIQRLIREMIAAENPAAPLSDQELTDMLNHKGYRISRRTITKYRETMGIPASNKRRQFV